MTRIFTRDTRGATLKQHSQWLESLKHEPAIAFTAGELIAGLAGVALVGLFVWFTLNSI